jgi:hypothetical protein
MKFFTFGGGLGMNSVCTAQNALENILEESIFFYSFENKMTQLYLFTFRKLNLRKI